jgi:hypothetical protein
MPASKLVFSQAPRGTSTRVSLLNCTMDTCTGRHADTQGIDMQQTQQLTICCGLFMYMLCMSLCCQGITTEHA